MDHYLFPSQAFFGCFWDVFRAASPADSIFLLLALIWGCKWKQEAKTFVHLTHNQPHRKTKQLSQLRDLPGLSASPLLSAGSDPRCDSTLCLLAQHQAFYPPALFRCCGIAVDVAQRLGCGALHAWGSQQGVRHSSSAAATAGRWQVPSFAARTNLTTCLNWPGCNCWAVGPAPLNYQPALSPAVTYRKKCQAEHNKILKERALLIRAMRGRAV